MRNKEMKIDWAALGSATIGQLKHDVWGESASKLFDFLMQRARPNENKITVPLSEYMQAWGFEEKEEALKHLQEDYHLLSGVSISTEGRAPGRFRDEIWCHWFTSLAGDGEKFEICMSDCLTHWLFTGEPGENFVEMAMSRKKVVKITVRWCRGITIDLSGRRNLLEALLFANIPESRQNVREYTMTFNKRPKSDWRGSNGRRAPVNTPFVK